MISPDGIDNSDGPAGASGQETRPLTEHRLGPAEYRQAACEPRGPVVLVYIAALAGGVIGIPAAIIQEMQAGLPLWLTAILVAPLVEELLKPIGVMFIMEKRPHWLRSGRQVVVMAALGAIVFATLENIMYLHLAHPEGGLGYALWRYIVCTLMHVSASIIFGVGLARMWLWIRREGIRFRIKGLLRYYISASVLHGLYNVIVLILAKTRVLTFG
ncbi:MAG: PrsW family glutamic-type intramembrane protease [Planctomycetota bacterium]|nr:PrsW family glutamic-type intramembrane protease [Planctomycetota bacterium]